jgi:hypothetical protein
MYVYVMCMSCVCHMYVYVYVWSGLVLPHRRYHGRVRRPALDVVLRGHTCDARELGHREGVRSADLRHELQLLGPAASQRPAAAMAD